MSNTITFEKYQSSGNDFIITESTPFLKLSKEDIRQLCNRKFGIGADGLIILKDTNYPDIFDLSFFNNDGSGDTFCGNGSLSTVDFIFQKTKVKTGYIKASDGNHKFNTNVKNDFINKDGIHSITMANCIIPKEIQIDNTKGFFINTGSPHFVIETDNLAQIDTYKTGKYFRRKINKENGGTNVDFISKINNKNNVIEVHTFERGVENETLSCGTGSVASSIIYLYKNNLIKKENIVKIINKGGFHYVSFKFNGKEFYDITLYGKPIHVFTANVNLDD